MQHVLVTTLDMYIPKYCSDNLQRKKTYFKSVVITYTYFTNCTLQDFVYPENVAYPVGGPGNARFLVMEIHYDNPDMQSGMLI